MNWGALLVGIAGLALGLVLGFLFGMKAFDDEEERL
jgi:uncharacterized protein YneF (UPF0154 family)